MFERWNEYYERDQANVSNAGLAKMRALQMQNLVNENHRL